MLLTALGVGGRPLSELLPGIVGNVFHSGAGGLSLLASSMGAGAILGGLWLGQRAHSSDLTRVAVGSSVLGAIAIIVAIATDRMWAAVPAVAVVGFSMSSAGIAVQSLIQLASDRPMRGRVMGLYGLIFRGAPAIGALSAGTASAYFGLRPPIIVGALLVLGVGLWTFSSRQRIAAALMPEATEAQGRNAS